MTKHVTQPGAARLSKATRGGRLALMVVLAVMASTLACAMVGCGQTSSEGDKAAEVETVSRAPLSEDRATTSLDGAGMTAPDISRYAYVAQDELIGPRFTDIKVLEPSNLDAPADVVVECTVTATAVFKNKGVEISVPVTLPFNYSVDSMSWVPGDLTQGDAIAVPLASAKASDILEHLDDILYAYDSTYGDDMAGAKIVKTKSDLTVEGGTITVELSKQAEYEEADGKKFNQLRTSKVELSVIWSNDAGWQVSVSKAGEIDSSEPVLIFDPTKKDEATANKNNNQSTTTKPADVQPVNVGKLSYGDKMAISGKLQKVTKVSQLSEDNNYEDKDASKDADGKVQLVLKLSQPITCTLNGEKYTLEYLAVAVSGLSSGQVQELIGNKADVSGTFEESFATSWCPGGIKALRVELG